MVATRILLTERAEALASLTETLAGLDGADEQVVRETAERAGNGLVGQDYMSALFLAQIAQVLQSQQERIAALEAQPQTAKRGARKSQRS